MKRALFTVFWFLLALVPFRPAAAQAPQVSGNLAENAALQYWLAFAQMPTLDKDQIKLLENWDKVPLDAAAQKLIDASAASRMYLQRGAKLRHCDWGLDYDDGVSLLLPHLAKARDLARLAALHARRELEQGRWDAGREEAYSIMVLGRHVGRDPIMICILVRFLIEGVAVDLLAPHVPEMKAAHATVVAQFESMPAAATVHQSIRTEKKFMAEWMIKKLQEEERRKKGAGLALWKAMLSSPETPEALPKIESFDEALKLVQDLVPVYDQIEKLAALPKQDFDAQYPDFKRKTQAANALAVALLPAMDKSLAKERRHQARLALLLAAIAVAESGPDKLADLKDPFGSGSFEYKALDQGFELKSKLRHDDQPVTLTVGRRN